MTTVLVSILIAIIVLYILYAPLAELLFHYLYIGTLRKGPNTLRSVALTFDDGPDARYTRQVLDILLEHQVKATFFLVVERAEKQPYMVRRMVDEGHEIALHSYQHKHAWALHPVETWRQVREAKVRLEQITGRPMRYYRPPWGAFNWATFVAVTGLRLKPVLWSLRAIDWLPGQYADKVVERVVGGAHPGAIVLCHDAGGADDAPLNTIKALPTIISRLRRLGYEFATVTDMHHANAAARDTMETLFKEYPLWRRGLIGVWSIVEVLFALLYRVHSVNRIFRISKTTWHHGDRRSEETGNLLVRDGCSAVDLHFQNETLLTFSAPGDARSLIRGLRQAREGFQDIAKMLQYDPRYRDVQVAMALTLMNRGVEALGFHIEDVPDTKENQRLQGYMRFLMGMYHPEGFSRLRQGRKELTMKLIWMTREEIIRHYGKSTPAAPPQQDKDTGSGSGDAGSEPEGMAESNESRADVVGEVAEMKLNASPTDVQGMMSETASTDTNPFVANVEPATETKAE